MLIATNVTLRYWFYPIGNTPAVNLLRTTRCVPEESVKILCLACGDVRNVLFTLWSEPVTPGSCYEFTTCDSEPAVLARNILLFSFLIDQTLSCGTQNYDQLLWEIYYHFFLSSEALEALVKHVKQLLEISRSMDTWSASIYAKSLRFLSDATLHKIRGFWQGYLVFYDGAYSEESTLASMQAVFQRSGANDHGIFLNGSRSLGMHGTSPSATKCMSDAFRAYWATGVVAGNEQDVRNIREEGNCHTNALLTLSSAPLGNLAVHYGSDPLLGFRLPEVFDRDSKATEIPERLADAAKMQFKSWCRSFVSHIEHQTVVIMFHCGEAVSLCYELQNHHDGLPKIPKDAYLYLRPWSSEILDLGMAKDPGTTHEYDVIDCSNISDHVGILNIFPAMVPLLSKNRQATIYTETLLPASKDPKQYLTELLRADVSAVFLIAGIAPTGSLLGVTTEHFGAEILMRNNENRDGSRNQVRMRLDWKRPSAGDFNAQNPRIEQHPAINVDPEELAFLFFKWYLGMFSNAENIANLMSFHAMRASSPMLQHLNHYTRITLVALIVLAVRNVHTDWDRCISKLLTRIEKEKTLIVGSNSLQELYMFLHMTGLYSTVSMRQTPELTITSIRSPETSHGGSRDPRFSGIVTVVLVVPRANLKFLTDIEIERLGTPGLHLAVYNGSLFENNFFSIHLQFGKLLMPYDGSAGTISEDSRGWRGNSDLIVTCPVPAVQFLVGDTDETRVALVINSTPMSSQFMTKLGVHMRIYDASVGDHDNVHIFAGAPTEFASMKILPYMADSHRKHLRPKIEARLSHDTLQCFCVRETFSSNADCQLLLEGAPVETSQQSPCTVTMALGQRTWTLEFPFPVNHSRGTTRIARKQAWVEFVAPMCWASQSHGCTLCPFPVIYESNLVATWGLSRVNLAQQPPLLRGADSTALAAFLGMTLSAKEMQSRGPTGNQQAPSSAWFSMKETVTALFSGFSSDCGGSQTEQRWKGFRLVCEGSSDTLFITSTARHDLDSGSLCLDCYVVPLTSERMPRISEALLNAVREEKLLGVRISPREEILWKSALPSLVERCQMSWDHTARCEYGARPFRSPLSVAHGISPICTCGEGQDIGSLPRTFSGFGRYATRIAIPTLSAIPYVETLALSSLLSSGTGAQK
jgi:hypothetical protein